ncbi:hypothetical protein [Undibacterium aquatile]|uniref:Chalcone isomerase-like protein n=1 Tax=Undibacterium aquatile TaxID=1537398 RepID=A0ABR6XJV0_9BURK|nr:hypothetical protein [Undibacterium aquatile]MBC3813187.1 hypothetical protein [Undibacterium aquatile]
MHGLKNFIFRHILLLIIALLGVARAYAFDLALVNQGDRVEDGKVQIGAREFPLPPGVWILTAKYKHRIHLRGTTNEGADVWTGYFVNLKNKQFRAAMELSASVSSTPTTRWMPEPCKRDDTVFKDSFNSRIDFPECLLITHNIKMFERSSQSWWHPTSIWFEEQEISLPTTTLATMYDKYQFGDCVLVRFWFNPELAGMPPSKNVTQWSKNDWHKNRLEKDPARSEYMQQFIAWSQSIPDAYRASLNKKATIALPDFPVVNMAR